MAPLALSVLLGVGCSTSKLEVVPEPGTDSYQEAAEAAFESAQAALERRDYAVAIERFERVRNRYPHSPLAALAELGIADALFGQDRHIEAADTYRTFVSLRPAHPRAAYAAFREGLSLMRQAPSELWIMPPAHEKDLTHVHDVERVLRRFLRDYPDSEHASEAEELLGEARKRLAEHEMYVADFYRKRGQWRAVILRLETALDGYAGLGFSERIRVDLAEAHLNLEPPDHNEALSHLEEVLSVENLEADLKSRAERLKARASSLKVEAEDE